MTAPLFIDDFPQSMYSSNELPLNAMIVIFGKHFPFEKAIKYSDNIPKILISVAVYTISDYKLMVYIFIFSSL